MSIALPPDREWLTAAEVAAENLPGFVGSKSQVNRLLSEGKIATRPRSGRGGGREFHFTSLPTEAQTEYLRRYGRASDELKTDCKPTRQVEKNLRAQARAAIVDAVERLIIEKGNVGKALKTFSKLYAAKKAGLEPLVYENQPTAAPDQVRAWRRALKREGLDGLLDGRGRPPKSSAFHCDLELKNIIIAEIGARPNLPVHCQKGGGLDDIVRIRLGREIPIRTLQTYVAPLRPKNNALAKALSAPGKFKNSHKTAVGSYSQDVTRINQRWEMDATRGDCMCIVYDAQGHKTERRVALTMVVDIDTRRACIVVSDQPSGAASRATIRKASLLWGLPDEIKTDNGKEFTNFAVERMCRELGIKLTFSRPFHPWEKPHVERMFGTVLSCLFQKLPGYVGRDVAQRQEIENKKSYQHKFGVDRRVLFEVELSPADLQARIDAWLERFYEQSLHIDIGTTPALMAKAHAGGARLVADERLLDALMMNTKVCTVSKGLIRYRNRFYASAETGAIEVTPRFNRRVQLRIDPIDPSWAAVYSPDGAEFLCIARDVDLLQPTERQRMAVLCSQNQDKVVNLFVRNIRKVGATHNIIDQLFASQVPGFELTDGAAKGMLGAAAHQLAKHTAMIEARDVMDTPAQPIEPTDEQREDAQRMIEAAKPTPLPMIQCNGYRRPAFEDDVDLIFWFEDFETNGGRIDDEDRARRKELFQSDLFLERLSIERRKQGRLTKTSFA